MECLQRRRERRGSEVWCGVWESQLREERKRSLSLSLFICVIHFFNISVRFHSVER